MTNKKRDSQGKENTARNRKRSELYNLLGKLPPEDYQVSSRTLSVEEEENYLIEHLILDLNGIEAVPAFFLKPIETVEKTPVVIFNHSHGGLYEWGKEELIHSSPYMYRVPYAEDLVGSGYSVLAIDNWAFGERRGRTESEIFKEMLWNGQVLWGMMVYDNIKALDYIESREDIDTDRIAVLGMSMGSTMSWWLAALDTRIKVCVDICCMTDFRTLIEYGGLDHHGIYYYVPDLLNHFTTAEINSLVCPRPHLTLNGRYDQLTPEKGLDIINDELKRIYRTEGVEERFQMIKYNVAHLETEEMRLKVLEFLQKYL